MSSLTHRIAVTTAIFIFVCFSPFLASVVVLRRSVFALVAGSLKGDLSPPLTLAPQFFVSPGAETQCWNHMES